MAMLMLCLTCSGAGYLGADDPIDPWGPCPDCQGGYQADSGNQESEIGLDEPNDPEPGSSDLPEETGIPPCHFGARGSLPCAGCEESCAHYHPDAQPGCLQGRIMFLPCFSCQPGCIWYPRSLAIFRARSVGWPEGSCYDDNPNGYPPAALRAVLVGASAPEEPLDDEPSPARTGAVAPFQRPALSEAQAAVVGHLDGPALVVSGAGSGKTHVVTQRIVRLCERGVKPEQILGLTFTRKAAKEMRERVSKRLPSLGSKVTLTTFHSLALAICREYPTLIDRRPRFGIWDDKVMLAEMRRILKELGSRAAGDEDPEEGELPEGVTPAACLKKIESYREAGEKDIQSISVGSEAAFTAICVYEQNKIAANVLDYTDLVWSAWKLLDEHPEIRQLYQARWTHVMCDEYQDTNDLQERFLRLLLGPSQNLVVVGDEDQSIYRFRGSNVKHIRTFPERYSGASLFPLGQNYRSSSSVVIAAANVISFNLARRSDKKIWTENPEGAPVEVARWFDPMAEGQAIAERFEASIRSGRLPEDHCVLVRTRRQFAHLQAALRGRGILYTTVGGLDDMQRPDVRRVLAWFRLILNPLDLSAGASCLSHWPKLGAVFVQAWMNLASRSEGAGFRHLDALYKLPRCGRETKKGQSLAWLQQTVIDLQSRVHQSGESIRSHVTWLYERIGLDREIDGLTRSTEDKAACREGESRNELKKAFLSMCPDAPIESSGMLALQSFVDLFLSRALERRRETGKVVLSTIHGAKGLEWPVVVVAGCVEGLLPYSAEDPIPRKPPPGLSADPDVPDRLEADFSEKPETLEEERRLMYVAMTRAREVLILSWFEFLPQPKADGSRQHCSSSRFLDEIGLTQAQSVEAECQEIYARLVARYTVVDDDEAIDRKDKQELLGKVEAAFALRDRERLLFLSQKDDIPPEPEVGKFTVRRTPDPQEPPAPPALPKISLRKRYP